MSNRELPMMPWFPDQFAASTASWTFKQRAVYRALLDLQWESGGCIPSSPVAISRALNCDARTVRNVWAIVGPKFLAVPGGLQNFRLEQHRLRALELRKSRVDKALSGATARWSKHTSSNAPSNAPSNAAGNAHAKPSQSSKNKTLSPYPLSRKRDANGEGRRVAPERSREPGAMREDDPEIQRKRREAETLAAQHAKGRDDDMPF